MPDLDNSVSTLFVRGTPGSQSEYWLRQVAVVTLAEVLHNFQHEASFKLIHDFWMEGEVVIRPRLVRGSGGSGGWPEEQTLVAYSHCS